MNSKDHFGLKIVKGNMLLETRGKEDSCYKVPVIWLNYVQVLCFVEGKNWQVMKFGI